MDLLEFIQAALTDRERNPRGLGFWTGVNPLPKSPNLRLRPVCSASRTRVVPSACSCIIQRLGRRFVSLRPVRLMKSYPPKKNKMKEERKKEETKKRVMEDVCNFSKDLHYDPGKPCRFCQCPTSKLWVPAVGDRGAVSNICVYKFFIYPAKGIHYSMCLFSFPPKGESIFLNLNKLHRQARADTFRQEEVCPFKTPISCYKMSHAQSCLQSLPFSSLLTLHFKCCSAVHFCRNTHWPQTTLK